MYYLQTKAPAGNWTDSLGSHDKEACIEHGLFMLNAQYKDALRGTRVVERFDVVVHEFKGEN